MSMKTSEKILKLREKNKSYGEISKLLCISKATVSYHCIKLNINEPININDIRILTDIEIEEMKEYYKTHSVKETAQYFNTCTSIVTKYTVNKYVRCITDEEKKIRKYERLKNWRQRMKEKSVEFLGGKCSVCGYNKCIWALEFHHRNPNEKDFGISQYSNLNWNRIKEELLKCDLLCSNCHKEHHHNNWNESK